MDALGEYRSTWDNKPVLRLVYNDFFRRLAEQCTSGPTLEIGGGCGNLKDYLPDVVTSDIQFSPLLDLVANAQHLPFANGALGNIVMLDVLHHIEYPILFFEEAARVLRAGGRIVMIEPAITWGSTLFYRFIHHEPVRMSVDPLSRGVPRSDRDPYESNQAIPTLIATRDRERFENAIGVLQIQRAEWFAFAVYPLSGGFNRWSMISPPLASLGMRLERRIEAHLGRLLGFRLLLMIEKFEVSA
jgi:SAM-dependent methyltransferase